MFAKHIAKTEIRAKDLKIRAKDMKKPNTQPKYLKLTSLHARPVIFRCVPSHLTLKSHHGRFFPALRVERLGHNLTPCLP